MNIRNVVIALTAAAALALTGCASNGGTDDGSGGGNGADGTNGTDGTAEDLGTILTEETAWGSADAESQPGAEPWLVLEPDTEAAGEFSGHDGCNGFSGTYTVNGETIELGPGVSTLIACPDVDTWLMHARTAEVASGELVLFDDSGAEIGRLPRTDA